ncbi:MAG: hypothetical protein HN389_00970 [Clostridia bacterium]|nr:hypothetical protein [Clostridia bacterium]
MSDYDKGLQHAMGMGKQNPADAHKYAQGTGGVSDYDKGLQHAMGMGEQNPADAHKYAQGTGGVKRVTDESLQMARNPENAYGIGTGGAKRVTDESLQMARNPENAYGIGTGGAKSVTDKSLQMARNPENAYGIGTGGAKRDANDRALMGVNNTETLNSRPDDYVVHNIPKDAARPDAFAVHDIPKDSARPDAFAAHNIPKSEDEPSQLKPQDVTRSNTYNTVDMNQDDAMSGNKEQMTSGGQPTQSYMDDMFGAGGAWEPSEVQSEALYNSHLNLIKAKTVLQKYENVSEYISSIDITEMDADEANEVAELGNTMLEEVKEETGITYDEALANLDNIENVIEGEKHSLAVQERIGELDENPDISFFDWEGSGLDVREQLDGYQGGLEQLTTVYDEKWAEYNSLPDGDEKIDMGYELKMLEFEKDNMETLISDTNIALDYDNDMEDLNLTQLVLRAQDMFYNQVNAVANESISLSNEAFNNAVELWKDGDDSAMRAFVYFTYGNEKDLEDIEDFNAFREDYCTIEWPWSGLAEGRNLLLEQESEVIDIIEPYFIKAVNYEKTDDGFTIILPTNLVFAMNYAKQMESDYDRDGNITDNVTHAASSVVGLVPVVGDVAAAGISLFGKILSDKYGVKEDMWDDAIARYDTLVFAGPMKEPYIKFEWNKKESDFENLEWWSEI